MLHALLVREVRLIDRESSHGLRINLIRYFSGAKS